MNTELVISLVTVAFLVGMLISFVCACKYMERVYDACDRVRREFSKSLAEDRYYTEKLRMETNRRYEEHRRSEAKRNSQA